MAATDGPFPSTQTSLFVVLETAAHELRELQSRHQELTSRIRSVRSAVNALRRLGGRQTVGPEGIFETNHAADAAQHGDEQLIRACRIALLETYDALSDDEIYARIVRRGSFRFADASFAKPSIARTLDAMATRGEVLRIVTPSETKWRRT